MLKKLGIGHSALAGLIAVILFSLALPPWATPTPASAEGDCQFVLGFKAIHDMIPEIVGDCVVDEYHNPADGNTLQNTTGVDGKGGLLVWRKVDNWTAYTDGYHTWVNGPFGLQQRLNTERFPWERDPVAAVPPTPTPTPTPQYNYYVETSSYPPQARRGGAVTFCARLTGVDAPPVFDAPARIVFNGITYRATTQAPDGNACVTVALPMENPKCFFDAWITYQGEEIATPHWAHREYCKILPY